MDTPEIIGRKDAKSRGLKRYFTGKPCPEGHVTDRYVGSGRCVICDRVKNKAWVKKNRDKVRAKDRRWREANRERARELVQRWRAANPGRQRANGRRARALRRARELGQMPPWTSEAEIGAIYDACSPGFQVDHWIPLAKGGLHCPENLIYLPGNMNKRKGASMPEEFAERDPEFAALHDLAQEVQMSEIRSMLCDPGAG